MPRAQKRKGYPKVNATWRVGTCKGPALCELPGFLQGKDLSLAPKTGILIRVQGPSWLPILGTNSALLTALWQNQGNHSFGVIYKGQKKLFFSKFSNGGEECLIDPAGSNLWTNSVSKTLSVQKCRRQLWVLIGEKYCAFTILDFITSQNGRQGFSGLIMQEVERKLKMIS